MPHSWNESGPVYQLHVLVLNSVVMLSILYTSTAERTSGLSLVVINGFEGIQCPIAGMSLLQCINYMYLS